jgi:Type I phosphodiesterase / nucleotide pyrophosphatase
VPAPQSPSSASDPSERKSSSAGRITRRSFLAGSAAIPLSIALGNKLPALALAAPKRYGAQGACGLPPYVLTRIWRGYDPTLSGQVIVVPHGRNFLGAGAPHASPWAYTQDVPMFWYGPGQVQPGFFSQPVTSADIAPTIAGILGIKGDFTAPDGNDLEIPLVLDRKPLKLIVVLVWDAGGRFVLDLWPQNWPHLRDLRKRGAWFDKATVGSSPSNTAPIHATIGTGAFPRHHGIIDNVMKFPDGRIRSSWADGPDMLRVPALAEVYQEAMGPAVAVGMAGSVSWHLGMVGHGNTDESAPRPVVVLKNDTDDGGDSAPVWEMPPSVKAYYRFADYVTQLPPLDDPDAGYFDFARKLDGTDDGLWRGKDVATLEGGWASPARIPYQHRAIKTLIAHEGFGHHDAGTDLLFVNYKVIDEIGHRYYASSDEMGDTVKAQDLFLRYFVNFLDKQVGEGEWMMLLTADHGHTAAPGVSGGYLINQHEVQNRIEGLEPGPHSNLLTQVRPMWLNIDDAELQSAGLTYVDVSRLVASLTRKDTASFDDPSVAASSTEPVFDAAFAGSLLTHLSCWSPPTG